MCAKLHQSGKAVLNSLLRNMSYNLNSLKGVKKGFRVWGLV